MNRILAVSFELDADAHAALQEAIAVTAQIVVLAGRDAGSRKAVLQQADDVLTRHPAHELAPHEIAAIGKAQLIQLMTAGVDFIPIGDLPPGVPVASNAGAYSEPMAEHALALTLAAAKRLLIEHAALARGTFNQFTSNRMLAGMVCGILGYGGIGQATARLMRGFGVMIHAINRSGTSSDPVDSIGTTQQLDEFLAAADVLVISAPLTRATQGLISARTGPDEGRCHPGQSGAWRDHRRGSTVRTASGTPEFHRVYRRLVGGTGSARRLSPGPSIHGLVQRDRLAA